MTKKKKKWNDPWKNKITIKKIRKKRRNEPNSTQTRIINHQ
jgi:hypothetical protein